MRKPEIQPFIPLIRSSFQVFRLLLGRHGIPDLIPVPVAEDIVRFGEDVEEQIDNAKGDEDSVSAFVTRGVVCSYQHAFYG